MRLNQRNWSRHWVTETPYPAGRRKQEVACFLRSKINECDPISFRVLRKMQVSAQYSETIDQEG
jgi:hypothetical protein